MIEHHGDLFEHLHTVGHIIGLSTNGTIKRDGRGVMGRGCALEAALRYPILPLVLGQHLKHNGNVPGWLEVLTNASPTRIVCLPVKHQWYQKADIDLIIMSIQWLDEQAKSHKEVTFHVPRLGCGNGRLSWLLQVRHLMASLPDNCMVHH
jgi:hypothetical protein